MSTWAAGMICMTARVVAIVTEKDTEEASNQAKHSKVACKSNWGMGGTI